MPPYTFPSLLLVLIILSSLGDGSSIPKWSCRFSQHDGCVLITYIRFSEHMKYVHVLPFSELRASSSAPDGPARSNDLRRCSLSCFVLSTSSSTEWL